MTEAEIFRRGGNKSKEAKAKLKNRVVLENHSLLKTQMNRTFIICQVKDVSKWSPYLTKVCKDILKTEK